MTTYVPGVAASRRALYLRLYEQKLAPLWEVIHQLVPEQPSTPCQPALWSYREVRPYLMEAGTLISAAEAIRRVLVLENPGMRGQSCITQSLYAGLQLILPGEVAPTHRHSQSALRFVVEGSGAYTNVDGERIAMHPGDLILTPSWTWHDHGHDVAEPVVWLDGLDLRIVQAFGAQFSENHPQGIQPVSRSEGSSDARYGHHLKPVNATVPFGKRSPIVSYPYSRSRDSLAVLAKETDPDPCHGWKMQFLNPHTGGSAIPTMAAFIQLIPSGFHTQPCRSTDGTVYCVVEGCGHVLLWGKTFAFEQHDVFVAPSWVPVSVQASDDVVLFSFSDRPGQEAMGLWREERG